MNLKSFERVVRMLCTVSIEECWALLKTQYGFIEHNYTTGGDRLQDRYLIRQGVSQESVCLVAHADTVLEDTTYTYKDDIVTSSELDDRLGIACLVYSIEAQLPLSQCCMLITDNEECGQSTAQTYTADCVEFDVHNHSPNWLMQFDRRGTDVVTYDYGCDMWHSLLTHSGFKLGQGSFSDICYMEELGVVGVNVGIGYHKEHTRGCHANLVHTLAQLQRAIRLYNRFGDIRLKHDTSPSRYYSKRDIWTPSNKTHSKSTFQSYDDYYRHTQRADDDTDTDDRDNWGMLSYEQCESCLEWFKVQQTTDWAGHRVCKDCEQAINATRYID